MSKIYEALLRAELDRAMEADESNRVEDTADASFAMAAGKPWKPTPRLPETSPDLEPEEPLFQSGAAFQERDARRSFTPTRTHWQPDEKSLPSLETRGAVVEQIRVLRSRLHELRLERPLKTILITSGLPQEGKSFTASNLAVAFAKFRNQRVLLIDGDMRRGRLHRVFGTPQEPGLSDYLANKAELGQVMQQMDPPGAGALRSLASLTFIPSGQDAENAADLSGNGRFQTLLQSVYDHFDWIILDSSPVTLVADGVNLARACDGVVLVARSGVTKYEVAQRAQQELKAAKIVGVVLNAVKGVPLVGGYYGYDA